MHDTTPAAALDRAADALKANGFIPDIVSTKEEAFEKATSLIPNGASVMNGASETLRQIGFIDYLKSGAHEWNNLHETILGESDPDKQALLRRQSVVSDWYLGSVHAVTEAGELLFASNSGSQLPHVAYTSPNLILIVGSQKVVPTLTDGFTRLVDHVIPLEDERMKGVYGFGTLHAKSLILHRENPALGRKVHVVLVKEPLGF